MVSPSASACSWSFVDIDASGAAATIRCVRARREIRFATPWRPALAGFALALGLGLLQHRTAAAIDHERDVLRDFAEVENVEGTLHTIQRGYAAPEILADPRSYPGEILGRPGESVLAARFRSAERHGYRFEFRGEQPECANPLSPVPPGFKRYAYAATPLAGRGRSYAIYSEAPGRAFVREDGRLPTLDDRDLALP